MTETTDPDGSGRRHRSSSDSDPEVVLAQALRAMAGGRAAPTASAMTTGGAGSAMDDDRVRRFSTVQLLLIAAIIGIVIGAVIGLTVLLL